jgi:hypothetical protein
MAGNIVVRLISIVAGLALAFLCAGIFLSIGLFSGYFAELAADLDMPPEGQQRFAALAVLAVGLVSSFKIASLALSPSAVTIIAAELMAWRSLVSNLLLGGCVGLATGWIAAGGETIGQGTVVVLLAAGFVGGFFYWLVAGRRAGAWRG